MATALSGQKKRWTRVCGRKVKTGCRTCKVRRLKCDEHKPECFRCQLTDRKCDGYGPDHAIVDRQKWRPSEFDSGPSSVMPPDSLPFLSTPGTGVVGDVNERRSFHHFRSCTADDLSGCFDSHFWKRLVLQLSHTEPAVKHAIIALSAAHERYQANEIENSAGPDLALQQYNKSIAHLNRQLSAPSRRNSDVALICCLLFICYESVRCNQEGALVHFTNGAKIVKDRQCSVADEHSSAVSYLDFGTDEEDVVELFRRLDVSRTAFLDTKLPELPVIISDILDKHFKQTTPFSSVSDAGRQLEALANIAMHHLMSNFQNRHEPEYFTIEIQIERLKLTTVFQQWALQFDALLKKPEMTEMTRENLQAAFTLIVQQKVVLIMLEASPWNEDRVLRKFEKDIEHVVSISAWLANPSTPYPGMDMPSADTPSKMTPTFSADLGYIAPLYYIVANSPDIEIRRKAVSILMIPRREGLWDSTLIAKVAQKVIDSQIDCKTDRFSGSVTDWAEHLGVL